MTYSRKGNNYYTICVWHYTAVRETLTTWSVYDTILFLYSRMCNNYYMVRLMALYSGKGNTYYMVRVLHNIAVRATLTTQSVYGII